MSQGIIIIMTYPPRAPTGGEGGGPIEAAALPRGQPQDELVFFFMRILPDHIMTVELSRFSPHMCDNIMFATYAESHNPSICNSLSDNVHLCTF